MTGTRTYLKRRDDGSWFRVVTDTLDPATVLDYGPVSDEEARRIQQEMADGTLQAEHVSERLAN